MHCNFCSYFPKQNTNSLPQTTHHKNHMNVISLVCVATLLRFCSTNGVFGPFFRKPSIFLSLHALFPPALLSKNTWVFLCFNKNLGFSFLKKSCAFDLWMLQLHFNYQTHGSKHLIIITKFSIRTESQFCFDPTRGVFRGTKSIA